MFYTFLAITVFFCGLIGFWAMRWWGLVLCAGCAIYIAGFSPLGGQLGTIATMVVFFAPMAIVAGVNHSRFKW